MPATQTIIDVDLQNLLTAIYTQNYLIDQTYINQSGNSNFLVYSAKLECTQGNKPTYLKLEEKTDTHTNQKYIGHGVTINGLPQANRSDAKPGVNIDEFGDCKLLRYEGAEEQKIIRSVAAVANISVCACIRNLEDQWQYFDEYDLVLVGEEYSISKKSALFCSPTQISAYQGNAAGKIQAVDSGQMNLYNLLQNYRYDYQALLQNSINQKGSLDVLNAFTQARIDEYLYLYELYYPDRVRVFDRFAKREINSGIYLTEVNYFKFMTYMLVEDKYTKKIADVMRANRTLTLVINVSNTDANFNSGTKKLTMTDIKTNRTLTIPYKTFFHELGHAIDYYEAFGNAWYSDSFLTEDVEWIPYFSIHATNNTVLYRHTTQKENKTIHQWAESDVKNLLYKVGANVVNTNAAVNKMSAQDKINLLLNLINNYFLIGDGNNKSIVLNAVENTIYVDIIKQANAEMQNQAGIINIAHDMCEGTSGAQIGGGHGFDYWYYGSNDRAVLAGRKNIGDRKNNINKEAFAGFFEYKAMGISDGIDPARNVLPKMIVALEKMLKEIL